MFLSIIIPVYNVELYLRECLDSIAASPLDCLEPILVDDGSPDRCPQICDEYAAKDSRFRVIHQDNAGVAAARNAGLNVAQGEWIWFVDSDDVVDMRPVGAMIEWLKANETAKLDANANENETLRYEMEQSSYENKIAELDVNENKEVRVKVNVSVEKKVDLVMFDLKTFKDNEGTSYETQGYETERRAYENEKRTAELYKNQNKNLNENDEVRVKVNVSVDKNGFLSQYVSFFHQQFWFRRVINNVNPNPNPNQKEMEDQKGLIHFSEGIRVAEDLERMYKYFTLCQQPVKFEATLYHYRVRDTSVTQDDNYRKKVLEDLPVVINNLAEWIRSKEIKPEPWIDFRIMKLMQNLLYSASQVNSLPFHDFQGIIRRDLKQCKHAQFLFPYRLKYQLAAWNVKAYFLFNRLYLKINANGGK